MVPEWEKAVRRVIGLIEAARRQIHNVVAAGPGGGLAGSETRLLQAEGWLNGVSWFVIQELRAVKSARVVASMEIPPGPAPGEVLDGKVGAGEKEG